MNALLECGEMRFIPKKKKENKTTSPVQLRKKTAEIIGKSLFSETFDDFYHRKQYNSQDLTIISMDKLNSQLIDLIFETENVAIEIQPRAD